MFSSSFGWFRMFAIFAIFVSCSKQFRSQRYCPSHPHQLFGAGSHKRGCEFTLAVEFINIFFSCAILLVMFTRMFELISEYTVNIVLFKGCSEWFRKRIMRSVISHKLLHKCKVQYWPGIARNRFHIRLITAN